jgi:hypothetical protein
MVKRRRFTPSFYRPNISTPAQSECRGDACDGKDATEDADAAGKLTPIALLRRHPWGRGACGSRVHQRGCTDGGKDGVGCTAEVE